MYGEPAQLHSTSVMAVAWIRKRGGWCAHLQGSARRPWADHVVCELEHSEPAQSRLTLVITTQIGRQGDGVHTHKGVHVIFRLTIGRGGGGTSNDINPMQDLFTDPVVPNGCAI